MSEISVCPKCKSENVYFDGMVHVCPDCNYELNGALNGQRPGLNDVTRLR